MNIWVLFGHFLQNHMILAGGFLAILLALVINEALGRKFGFPKISTARAIQLINREDAHVVDVRSTADFKKGHILNALSFPLSTFDARATELDKYKEKPILLYCTLGNMASDAARRLKKRGYTQLFILQGGVNAWESASLPLTK